MQGYYNTQQPTVGVEGSDSDIWLKDGDNDNIADISIANLSVHIKDIFSSILESYSVYASGVKPVITSANDGKHRANSKHYQNEAIDLRGNVFTDSQQDNIASHLSQQLGGNYDVVSEHDYDNPKNDHIHIEYDPANR